MKMQLFGGAGPAPPRPEVSNWTSKIEEISAFDGCVSYRADVFDSLAFVCRIVLSSPFCTEDEVVERLAVQRDHWIAEYEERDRLCALA